MQYADLSQGLRSHFSSASAGGGLKLMVAMFTLPRWVAACASAAPDAACSRQGPEREIYVFFHATPANQAAGWGAVPSDTLPAHGSARQGGAGARGNEPSFSTLRPGGRATGLRGK
jgi:hypothetical protein